MFHNLLLQKWPQTPALNPATLSVRPDLSLRQFPLDHKSRFPLFCEAFSTLQFRGAGFNAKAAKVCAKERRGTDLDHGSLEPRHIIVIFASSRTATTVYR